MSTTDTVKMPKAVKIMSYNAYTMTVDYLKAQAKRDGSDLTDLRNNVYKSLEMVVYNLHGLRIAGAELFVDILIRLTKENTKKATGLTTRKLNGIAGWHKLMRDYPTLKVDDFAFNAGDDPSIEKPKKARKVKTEAEKLADAKEAAITRLSNLPQTELAAVIETLMGKMAA